jgi:hypothetical protein
MANCSRIWTAPGTRVPLQAAQGDAAGRSNPRRARPLPNKGPYRIIVASIAYETRLLTEFKSWIWRGAPDLVGYAEDGILSDA